MVLLSQKKVTGGRHGYGAKLANIFSHSFEVEIRDVKHKKTYFQKWEDNMSKVSPPVITDLSEEEVMNKIGSYTKITFTPDLKPFSTVHTISKSKKESATNFATLQDTEKILYRRLVDLCATVHPVKVYYNKKALKIKSFEDYVKLFVKKDALSDGTEAEVSSSESVAALVPTSVHVEAVNSRWTVGVIPSPSGTFEHMSFVNGIWTMQGGSHVNYLSTQCVKYVEDILEKKYQLKTMPTNSTIKNKLMVFVQCLVENPSFDSQSKDALTSTVSEFGSKCKLTKSFLKIALEGNGSNTNIVQMICNSARIRERSRLLIPEKGQFGKTSINVPKLEDAHAAGTKHSLDCTLILTEGESAKALARAGLEVIGRDKYGILSLQGKILNVSNSPKDALKNKELLNFGQAMGLNFNKTYSDTLKNQGLRYGHILIMTDQDTDGSHIKGLVLNFIAHYWPHLLRYENFIQQFHTPLLKIFNVPTEQQNKKGKKKGSKTLDFYSTPEYEEYRRDFIEQKGIEKWKKLTIKYYKVMIIIYIYIYIICCCFLQFLVTSWLP
jgi:DNA topoisomerase II